MSTDSARQIYQVMGREPGRYVGRTGPRLLVTLLLLVGSMASCMGVGDAIITESHAVPAGNARSVHVELAMQPGNLQVRGGASQLVNAQFIYRPTAWRPTISYRVRGSRGELVIRQPQLQAVTNGRNTWDVRLSERLPIDLQVRSGPGNATLHLRPLTLTSAAVSAGPGNLSIDAGSPSLKSLQISAGPGNLTVNLIARWKHNVTATVDGGIGNTTLRLPAAVGVRVTVAGRARVDAPDFMEQSGAYVNSAFGRSKTSIRVALRAGLGNVVLITGS